MLYLVVVADNFWAENNQLGGSLDFVVVEEFGRLRQLLLDGNDSISGTLPTELSSATNLGTKRMKIMDLVYYHV